MSYPPVLTLRICSHAMTWALLSVIQLSSQLATAAEPPSVSGQRLLLVDDHHVPYRAGTKRLFHPATPYASNPVIREDLPWEMAIGWTSVYRDPDSGGMSLGVNSYSLTFAAKHTEDQRWNSDIEQRAVS